MKDFWNDRYSDADYAYGTEANDFLRTQYAAIPVGNVLCLAEGEGRNAVFLATQGYTVTAVDQSRPGLEKTVKLADRHGVRVETIEADLQDFAIEPGAWEGVVSISAHLPPALRKRLHREVVAGLKPGGVLILEAYTEQQLETAGIGGPPAEQRDVFMSLSALESELVGLELLIARETERVVNEGKYHQGPAAVVQIVARKS